VVGLVKLGHDVGGRHLTTKILWRLSNRNTRGLKRVEVQLLESEYDFNIAVALEGEPQPDAIVHHTNQHHGLLAAITIYEAN
jgi:hypothetical protein